MIALLLFPFTFLSGRAWPEVSGRRARDYGTSITIGVFAVIASLIIGVGQYLYWSGKGNPNALMIALGITALFLVMDRFLMRALEVVGGGKVLLITLRFILAAINGYVATHEILILNFSEQVIAQGKDAAAKGVTAHSDALSSKYDTKGKSAALQAAQAEYERLTNAHNTPPAAVVALNASASACNSEAAAMAARLPSRDDDRFAAMSSAVRTKRGDCTRITREAGTLMQQHKSQYRDLIDAKKSELAAALAANKDAAKAYADSMQADGKAIENGLTTGAARHDLLWAAVAAGRISLLTVIAYTVFLSILEILGFILKIVLPRDAVTAERIHDELKHSVHSQLDEGIARESLSLVKSTIRAQRETIQSDLSEHVKDAVMAAFKTNLATHAFDRANEGLRESMSKGGTLTPGVFERMAQIAQRIQMRRRERKATQEIGRAHV